MHSRDELARATTHQRQAARASLEKANAKPTYSVAAASALAVGLVTGLLVTAGWQLAKPFALSNFWRNCLVIGTLFSGSLITGMGTEWLCRHRQPHGEARWRCGVGVWAWLTGAAMFYCFCNGMPVLITAAVLFIYGLPLHILVLGSATVGAGLTRYWRKRAARRVL